MCVERCVPGCDPAGLIFQLRAADVSGHGAVEHLILSLRESGYTVHVSGGPVRRVRRECAYLSIERTNRKRR